MWAEKERVQRPSGSKHAWHVPEDEKLFSQRAAGVLFTLTVLTQEALMPIK